MTFRRLTNEELAPLEKKFIQFLVSNTITGDDWAKMKERRPEQAMGLIDIFSDIIFEESLKKVQFLTLTLPKELKIFYFKEDGIELLGLGVDENSMIDFTKGEEWLKSLQHTEGGVSVFKTEKKYAETREVEIFKMIESGCRITDNYLYEMLQKIV